MAKGKFNADGNIECDFCEEPAIINYQQTWISWRVFPVSAKKDYATIPKTQVGLGEPMDDDNVHLCGRHEQLWRDGEIG